MLVETVDGGFGGGMLVSLGMEGKVVGPSKAAIAVWALEGFGSSVLPQVSGQLV